jgi:hypothetical protein
MKLFQYAVIFTPKAAEGQLADAPKLIVDLKTVLAKDINQASILAARDIPAEYCDKLDQCEVAVRPF